jgi:histone H3/H4
LDPIHSTFYFNPDRSKLFIVGERNAGKEVCVASSQLDQTGAEDNFVTWCSRHNDDLESMLVQWDRKSSRQKLEHFTTWLKSIRSKHESPTWTPGDYQCSDFEMAVRTVLPVPMAEAAHHHAEMIKRNVIVDDVVQTKNQPHLTASPTTTSCDDARARFECHFGSVDCKKSSHITMNACLEDVCLMIEDLLNRPGYQSNASEVAIYMTGILHYVTTSTMKSATTHSQTTNSPMITPHNIATAFAGDRSLKELTEGVYVLGGGVRADIPKIHFQQITDHPSDEYVSQCSTTQAQGVRDVSIDQQAYTNLPANMFHGEGTLPTTVLSAAAPFVQVVENDDVANGPIFLHDNIIKMLAARAGIICLERDSLWEVRGRVQGFLEKQVRLLTILTSKERTQCVTVKHVVQISKPTYGTGRLLSSTLQLNGMWKLYKKRIQRVCTKDGQPARNFTTSTFEEVRPLTFRTNSALFSFFTNESEHKNMLLNQARTKRCIYSYHCNLKALEDNRVCSAHAIVEATHDRCNIERFHLRTNSNPIIVPSWHTESLALVRKMQACCKRIISFETMSQLIQRSAVKSNLVWAPASIGLLTHVLENFILTLLRKSEIFAGHARRSCVNVNDIKMAAL